MQLPDPPAFLNRKYELVKTLGEGGFARVYLARDVELGRQVAVKVLVPRNGEYPTKVERRFAREARVLGGLHSPHTVRMFEFGRTDEGLAYMVFEYLQGRDLARLVREKGSLAADVVEHILSQMLSALEEAHAAGVLHRDIKPDATRDARSATSDAATDCRSTTVGKIEGSLFSGLDSITYRAYIPQRPAGTALPVILIAHQLFGGGRDFIAETRFFEAAEEHGFVLIAMKLGGQSPQEVKRLFLQAYDEIATETCLDRRYTYAVGHAAGARIVRHLRCEMPLSGIATTSDGQRPTEHNCRAEPEPPRLIIQGLSDPHLPLDGSKSCMGKRFLGLDRLTEVWKDVSGCTSEAKPRTWESGRDGACTLWRCAADFVVCGVPGGFDWPHAPEPIEMPGCRSDPIDFPVRTSIARFFTEFGRPVH